MNNDSLVYSLEGIDGSGKSTQAKRVCEELTKKGVSILCLKNPADNALGNFIRRHLSEFPDRLKSELFVLDIQSTLERVQQNNIQVILWDRYTDSIYTSNKEETIASAEKITQTVPKPRRTFLLDITPEIAIQRRKAEDTDNFEWQRQKYARYRELIKNDSSRFVVIDGLREPETITKTIVDVILGDLGI